MWKTKYLIAAVALPVVTIGAVLVRAEPMLVAPTREVAEQSLVTPALSVEVYQPDILPTPKPVVEPEVTEPVSPTVEIPPTTPEPSQAPPQPAVVVSENRYTRDSNKPGFTDYLCTFNLSDGSVSPEVFAGRAPTIDSSKVTIDCPRYQP